jgi:hypothetical protein
MPLTMFRSVLVKVGKSSATIGGLTMKVIMHCLVIPSSSQFSRVQAYIQTAML